MNNIFINGYELSQEQINIIKDNNKYTLIIACAGTGKTTTLVGKIKYLLDNNLLSKDEICPITFTNNAVNNLEEAIYKNTNTLVPCYTFHKLAIKILKDNKINYNFISDKLLSYIIDEFYLSHAFNNKYLKRIILNRYHYLLDIPSNYNKIFNSPSYLKDKELITTFINLVSSNNINDLSYIFPNKDKFIYIIYSIYLIYKYEKESSNELDFDDLIKYTTKIINENRIVLPYKLILVDEFQDTSLLRLNFIKSLLNKSTKLICVGDDYQSIYRFSGCNLDIFLNFKTIFPNSKEFMITNTYRNSKELLDITSSFITKNPYQIKKNLTSKISLNKPINIIYYHNSHKALIKLLTQIKDKNILILSRYHKDINLYLKDYKLDNNNLYIKTLNSYYTYMTIHESKGLESDIVIILNMTNNIMGFPSKIKDNSLLNYVNIKSNYPYDEERRLFYVALTRTKSFVYLLTDINNPSIFIKELKNSDSVKTTIMKFL